MYMLLVICLCICIMYYVFYGKKINYVRMYVRMYTLEYVYTYNIRTFIILYIQYNIKCMVSSTVKRYFLYV